MSSSNPPRKPKKVGQELGDVRSPLPLERLEVYLQRNVEGFQGPLEVQQFKVYLLNRTFVS
jgi:hypothetical protein